MLDGETRLGNSSKKRAMSKNSVVCLSRSGSKVTLPASTPTNGRCFPDQIKSNPNLSPGLGRKTDSSNFQPSPDGKPRTSDPGFVVEERLSKYAICRQRGDYRFAEPGECGGFVLLQTVLTWQTIPIGLENTIDMRGVSVKLTTYRIQTISCLHITI